MEPWPSVLRPVAGGFAPFSRTLSGGPSLTGFEQTIPQIADRWRASFTLALRTDEQVLALRKLLARLRGRANTVALPFFDRRRAPWEVNQFAKRITPGFARHLSLAGTPWADAAGLADTLIDAEFAAAAAAQDTLIYIRIWKGGPLVAGMIFGSLSRGYVVSEIIQDQGSGLYTVEIWPWLRRSCEAGTKIDFTSPDCEMRLMTDEEGADALRSLEGMRFATVTLSFEEVVYVAMAQLDFNDSDMIILEEPVL